MSHTQVVVRVPFPHPDRLRDVLGCDLAAVPEGHVDPVADTLLDDPRHTDAARFGQRLQTSRRQIVILRRRKFNSYFPKPIHGLRIIAEGPSLMLVSNIP